MTKEKESASKASIKKPNYEAAQKKADELTAIFPNPPIPIVEIAEENGVEVVWTDFGTFTDDVSGFCDFKKCKLYINRNDRKERQNFTIAHELGHWLLHQEQRADYEFLPRFTYPQKDNPLEKEANTFAAHFLMPSRLLKPLKGKAGLHKLAYIFDVSPTAMAYRLKNV